MAVRKQAMLGVGFLALAALLTGCGGSPQVARSSTTSYPSSSTATITELPSTTERSVTVLNTYDPWAASGDLKPGVSVASRVNGKCTGGDGRVYDCSSNTATTYYLCWPSTSARPSEVACPIRFSTEVVMMTLTDSLPSPSGTFQSQEDLVSVVLVNGDQCSELWGTAAGLVEGVSLDYGCNSPSGAQFYAGGLDSSSTEWTMQIDPSCYALPTYSCTGPLEMVGVTEAWQ